MKTAIRSKMLAAAMALSFFAAPSFGSTLDDATITASIKASLVKDQRLKAFDIEVSTDHGKVHLSGLVDSSVEKADAERIAKGTDGVTDVKNDIKVK